MLNINVFFLIIILIIFESIGLYYITYYNKHRYILYYIIGCLIYGIIFPYLILRALKYKGIATVNFIGNILSTIIMILIGYYFFKEKMNYIKILGFIIGFISIMIIYYSDN